MVPLYALKPSTLHSVLTCKAQLKNGASILSSRSQPEGICFLVADGWQRRVLNLPQRRAFPVCRGKPSEPSPGGVMSEGLIKSTQHTTEADIPTSRLLPSSLYWFICIFTSNLFVRFAPSATTLYWMTPTHQWCRRILFIVAIVIHDLFAPVCPLPGVPSGQPLKSGFSKSVRVS